MYCTVSTVHVHCTECTVHCAPNTPIDSFIFCSLSLKNRKEKSPAKVTPQLLFKGRIPLESLETEDVEDGRSDYHTNGITVTNGWKCRNSVKNKWFVLIAKTSQDKKEWLEAVRSLKEKRKRENIHQYTEQLSHERLGVHVTCGAGCACYMWGWVCMLHEGLVCMLHEGLGVHVT